MMVIMLMFDTMMRLDVEASDNRHDYDDFFANDDYHYDDNYDVGDYDEEDGNIKTQ